VDWNTHFRRISATSHFGSIMGQQSIADLKDLITAQDNSIAQLQQHFDQTSDVDPDLMNDWNNLKIRYNAAKGDAESVINVNILSVIPDAATPAQTQYDEILKALKQNYPTLTVTKGDLQDIFSRFPFDMSPLPQPTATDYDLTSYQALDTTTRSMPSFIKTAIATVAPGLVPKTSDQSSYKPLSTTTEILIAIGIIAGIVLVGKVIL
jgi:hypothetical protein